MVINWDYIDVAECECNKRVMIKEKQKPPTVTFQRKPLSEPVVVKALKKREMRQKKERKKERREGRPPSPLPPIRGVDHTKLGVAR